MSATEKVIALGESVPLPDALTRAFIAWLVGRTARTLRAAPRDTDRAFADAMAEFPVALNVDAANAQHYEIPAEFFSLVLGPQRKYSCCLYDSGINSLIEAEERALELTAAHADLGDGQRILELGCGWGSLSLWMARRYHSAQIVAVSNSQSQRRFINGVAAASGLPNLEVVTADMNTFKPSGQFDRVVSVEMFEHMANWGPLLLRMRNCLNPNGLLFLHVFTNAHMSYRFDINDRADWIAKHFFTGGIMPSDNLIRQFNDCFTVEQEWRWNGSHYARTAADWLENYDRNAAAIHPILKRVYGRNARLWQRRWRLFFLATVGLFGYSGGDKWGVSHYRLAPVSANANQRTTARAARQASTAATPEATAP
jgi:cyclopropane-fatty-acyl-phospholipid synthase